MDNCRRSYNKIGKKKEKKKGKKKEKKMIQAISQGDSCIVAYSYLTILFYVVSLRSR